MNVKNRVNELLAIMFAAVTMCCVASPTMLSVDESVVVHCRKVMEPNVLGELFLYDLFKNVAKKRIITRDYPYWSPEDVPKSYVNRFPRAWNIVNGVLTIVYPDFFSSATADVLFQRMTMTELEAFCEDDAKWNTRTSCVEIDSRGLDFMASGPFPIFQGRGLTVRELSLPWYAIGDAGMVVRLPSDRLPSYGIHRWSPEGRTISNLWVEVSWDGSIQSHENRGALTCFDGFYPVAGVCILGKNVRSDIADFIAPGKADWLIWERKDDEYRLCQMRDGRWSVCESASRKDAPKIIVVNNEEKSVFLSFSLEFDAGDVSNSIKRTIAYLKEHDVLHPERPKLSSRAPTNGDLAIEKNCKTGGSETSLLVPVANRETVRKDSGRNKINKIDTAAIKRLPPEEQAKKGAELYENPETRNEGLAILRRSAKNGSPFALARLSALYYLGEGGVRMDYDTALRLMKSAAAKGFPRFLLPIAEAEAALKREKARKSTRKSIGLGDGYAGRLEPYKVTPELRKQLDQFGLAAGWFRRNPIPDGALKPHEAEGLLCNELPYLLYTPPQSGQKPVPMIVYFGGTGEQGSDLMAHFRQTTIFSKVTSPEFQKKHPCYLFAPMVPKGAHIACLKGWSPPMADLLCDAMFAVIREEKNPRVDVGRIYLTGLSYGGSAAWSFPFGYPGRFAASLPVGGYVSQQTIPDSNPGNIWLIYNEDEYSSDHARKELADIKRIVAERGGEFRVSPIPDKGHNAWDKAWCEEAVWDWMFSKSTMRTRAKKSNGVSSDFHDAVCTASKPGRDDGTGPARAADGLDATCYVSAEAVSRGDWWQIEFAQPLTGRITVKSGYRNGTGHVSSAHIEVSSNGRIWNMAGRFRRVNGECTFVPRGPIKYLRVISDSKGGEILVLREIVVQ